MAAARAGRRRGEAGGRSWTREVGGGYGHMGMQNDTVVHFGLGGCPAIDEVTVRWPNAQLTTQTWRGLAARKFYRLTQGDPAAAIAFP
ncbi:MAG: ASPIC/UnbV protein [Myxococcaceae bacterium]|nr:ASPIC/UnbV protein [Myxococcaceae bacterium]